MPFLRPFRIFVSKMWKSLPAECIAVWGRIYSSKKEVETLKTSKRQTSLNNKIPRIIKTNSKYVI